MRLRPLPARALFAALSLAAGLLPACQDFALDPPPAPPAPLETVPPSEVALEQVTGLYAGEILRITGLDLGADVDVLFGASAVRGAILHAEDEQLLVEVPALGTPDEIEVTLRSPRGEAGPLKLSYLGAGQPQAHAVTNRFGMVTAFMGLSPVQAVGPAPEAAPCPGGGAPTPTALQQIASELVLANGIADFVTSVSVSNNVLAGAMELPRPSLTAAALLTPRTRPLRPEVHVAWILALDWKGTIHVGDADVARFLPDSGWMLVPGSGATSELPPLPAELRAHPSNSNRQIAIVPGATADAPGWVVVASVPKLALDGTELLLAAAPLVEAGGKLTVAEPYRTARLAPVVESANGVTGATMPPRLLVSGGRLFLSGGASAAAAGRWPATLHELALSPTALTVTPVQVRNAAGEQVSLDDALAYAARNQVPKPMPTALRTLDFALSDDGQWLALTVMDRSISEAGERLNELPRTAVFKAGCDGWELQASALEAIYTELAFATRNGAQTLYGLQLPEARLSRLSLETARTDASFLLPGAGADSFLLGLTPALAGSRLLLNDVRGGRLQQFAIDSESWLAPVLLTRSFGRIEHSASKLGGGFTFAFNESDDPLAAPGRIALLLETEGFPLLFGGGTATPAGLALFEDSPTGLEILIAGGAPTGAGQAQPQGLMRLTYVAGSLGGAEAVESDTCYLQSLAPTDFAFNRIEGSLYVLASDVSSGTARIFRIAGFKQMLSGLRARRTFERGWAKSACELLSTARALWPSTAADTALAKGPVRIAAVRDGRLALLTNDASAGPELRLLDGASGSVVAIPLPQHAPLGRKPGGVLVATEPRACSPVALPAAFVASEHAISAHALHARPDGDCAPVGAADALPPVVVGTAALGRGQPVAMAVTPNGRRLLVQFHRAGVRTLAEFEIVRHSGANPANAGWISRIDLARTVELKSGFAPSMGGMAFDATGGVVRLSAGDEILVYE